MNAWVKFVHKIAVLGFTSFLINFIVLNFMQGNSIISV